MTDRGGAYDECWVDLEGQASWVRSICGIHYLKWDWSGEVANQRRAPSRYLRSEEGKHLLIASTLVRLRLNCSPSVLSQCELERVLYLHSQFQLFDVSYCKILLHVSVRSD